MNNTTRSVALEGDYNETAAVSPLKIGNLSGAAGAAAPLTSNNTSAGNRESSAQVEDNTTSGEVTPETALDITTVEAEPSVRDKILAVRKAPEQTPDSDTESATDENQIEEITAEEIMAKHAEQSPSEENGFSLDEVVATDQVVPTNLARPAGVSLRKPNDKEFIRVSQNPGEIMPFDILEIDDNTKYIVTPAAMAAINKLHDEMGQVMIKTKRVMMHLTVNMDGIGFLWPITVTDAENTWIESANNCASIAKNQWIRIVSNNNAKRYDFHPANKNAGVVPKWPKETFIEMLNLAFKSKVIRSLDHPAIKQLLDEE
jgi:hypothetical protein